MGVGVAEGFGRDVGVGVGGCVGVAVGAGRFVGVGVGLGFRVGVAVGFLVGVGVTALRVGVGVTAVVGRGVGLGSGVGVGAAVGVTAGVGEAVGVAGGVPSVARPAMEVWPALAARWAAAGTGFETAITPAAKRQQIRSQKKRRNPSLVDPGQKRGFRRNSRVSGWTYQRDIQSALSRDCIKFARPLTPASADQPNGPREAGHVAQSQRPL